METKVKKYLGSWAVEFTQGNQSFILHGWKQSKKEAIWQKEMLDKCFANFLSSVDKPSDEDLPEIDFRKDIADELSRDELIERLCEMHKSYTEMRKEWFEKTILQSEQPEKKEVTEETAKEILNKYTKEDGEYFNIIGAMEEAVKQQREEDMKFAEWMLTGNNGMFAQVHRGDKGLMFIEDIDKPFVTLYEVYEYWLTIKDK